MLLGVSLFLASFLAATILPFSSEVALIGALKGGLDPKIAFFSASLGNVLAIVVNYFLGLFLYKKTKRKLLASKIGKKAYNVARRYGYVALLFSWLPIIGDPITLAAGLMRLNFWIFLVSAGGLRIMRYVGIVLFSNVV